MSRPVRGALVLALALAAPALAGDVCFTMTGGLDHMVLRKVKKLKPGGAIPVNGIYVSASGPGQAAPVQGTAIMTSTGVVKLGAFVHGIDFLNDFTVSLVLDSNFEGTGKYDSTGAYVPSGSFAAVTREDCSTIALP